VQLAFYGAHFTSARASRQFVAQYLLERKTFQANCKGEEEEEEEDAFIAHYNRVHSALLN
jgi:hypothetical protein